jgi:hypothetical protein
MPIFGLPLRSSVHKLQLGSVLVAVSKDFSTTPDKPPDAFWLMRISALGCLLSSSMLRHKPTGLNCACAANANKLRLKAKADLIMAVFLLRCGKN